MMRVQESVLHKKRICNNFIYTDRSIVNTLSEVFLVIDYRMNSQFLIVHKDTFLYFIVINKRNKRFIIKLTLRITYLSLPKAL